MVGTDTDPDASRPALVRGDADVTVDLDNATIDIAFTKIRNVDGDGSRTDMNWPSLGLTSGRFKHGTDGDSIEGTFYGPNHEEVGGIFEHGGIIGAFGAKQP